VIDRRDAGAEERQVAAAGDSHAPPTKPRRKRETLASPRKERNSLDVSAAIPLTARPVLTYAEVAALGIAPERTLRRLVAVGRVKRSVLRAGRRVRFVVQDLLDELRGAEE
jgi:hypothetical protein